MTETLTGLARFITDVVPISVLPHIGSVLGPDELLGLSIGVEVSDYSLSRSTDGPDGSTYVLRLDVRGEVFMLHLFDSHVEETVEQLSDRVLSELQTWVAESSFGWGEQRGTK